MIRLHPGTPIEAHPGDVALVAGAAIVGAILALALIAGLIRALWS
jgi:hypothetical protein